MWITLVIGLVAALAGFTLRTPFATAAAGDIGYQGPSYAGAGSGPTADKPQSKLWFNDGYWWADMFDSVSRTWHIFRLDRSAQTWIDTGTRIDDRPSTRGDVLWDGTKLYVATNVLASSSSGSVSGQPARLYRYSYTPATDSYSLDSGFPVNINNYSSESLTIDKDSRGVLWATWTQNSRVYVNATNGSDNTWGTPFTLPGTGATGLSSDDISSVAAFGRSRVGVMWSNQNTDTFYFALHRDGDATGTWTTRAARSDPGVADDHISLKQLEGDDQGHLYAAIKTSLDSTGSSAAQTQLLSLNVTSGNWDVATFGTVADCHTRPMIVIDGVNRVLRMYATAPSSGGCPSSGTPGTIYEKSTSLTSLSFPPGRGTPVIRDAASAYMNNVTGTKQNVSPTSGLVLLASNDDTSRYWHADIPLSGSSPTVSFTASPTRGTAPLSVNFTDTSTGGVTSWSWTFGDGGTSTQQNPSYTYTTPGTYTATLTGQTASGASSSSSRTIQVNPPSTGGGTVSFGGVTSTGTATAGRSVTLTKPSRTAAGDVLVASFTTNNAPNVTAPSGWTALMTPLRPNGASLFAYYRVITSSDATATSWTWTLSSSQTWSGGVSRYLDVNPTQPLDSSVRTARTTSAASSVTVPAVTTTTAGAMLIGGMGADSSRVTGTPPSGWTEAWQNRLGQLAESAYRATTTVGSQGTTTWRHSGSVSLAAWTVALRPRSA